ncbi:Fic family protein [Nocardia sp. NPDC019395]|uniref:type II toxin-antitoxin system death-on-curing family toxin n=1 Tax=Nocardia sp. NPDC019395 TaxID=3154686 RepID=UPI003411627E
MTGAEIYYLNITDLRAIADQIAGGHIIRDPGLLESATARPQATVFGIDAYPSLWDKATALLHSIARHRPLIDGNEQLAIAAGAVFLARNGVDIDGLDEDLTYDLMIAVATGELDEVADIAEQLRKAIGATPPDSSG